MAVAFLGLAALGCSDDPPVSPGAGAVNVTATATPAREVPGFFSAFSWHFHAYTTPILTVPYDPSQCYMNPAVPCLNPTVYRQQWNNVWDWTHVADWAATNPGHLYILGDALHHASGFGGLYVNDPTGWARDYCRFVRNVRAVDPTSKFTPGLIEHWATDAWLDAFSVGMLAEYQAGRCSTQPVAEWEWNFYPNWSRGLEGFKAFVDHRANWAASQPTPIAAPSVLSAWVVGWGGHLLEGETERKPGDDVPNDDPAYLERLREVKAWLFAHEKIVHARYLAYEPWPDDNPDPHPLTNADGTLNATGRVYAEVTGRIAGPKVVSPQSSCSWVAETTGGPAPYSFRWIANGRAGPSNAAIAVVRPDSAFTLELTVTDASGGHSTTRLDVKVMTDAPPCS